MPFSVRRALLVCLLATPLVPSSARGQEAVDHWRVQLELGFNGASGNSSFSILRTGGKATHLRTDVAEFEASFLVRYGKNDEKVIADDAKATLKFDLWPKGAWSPFVFADVARDGIRRLDGRFSGGAGGKWTFWESAGGEASLSAAALWDYQNFKVAAGSAGPQTENSARWSVRTKLEKKLSSTATFEQVAFYQPVWDAASDYTLDVTSSVTTKVLGNLDLALEHQYLRDATPPEGVGPDDQRFSVVVKVTF